MKYENEKHLDNNNSQKCGCECRSNELHTNVNSEDHSHTQDHYDKHEEISIENKKTCNEENISETEDPERRKNLENNNHIHHHDSMHTEHKHDEQKLMTHKHVHNEHIHKKISNIKLIFNWIGIFTGLYGNNNHSHHNHNMGESEMKIHKGMDHGPIAFVPKLWILILGLSLSIFALFVMIWGALIEDSSSFYLAINNQWLWLIFGIVIFILIGVAFIKSSISATYHKKISMDILVAVSGTIAFIYSIIVFILGMINGDISLSGNIVSDNFEIFFKEEVEILGIIYLSRFTEKWLSNRITKEMTSLESLKVKDATIIINDSEILIPVKDLKIGDTIIVKPGLIIPIDGVILKGETIIDESSLTGEVMPINKVKGSSVYGGTISSSALIYIKVTKLSDDSFINKIIRGVNDAISNKPQTQKMADKLSVVLIPIVLFLTLITFIAFWLIQGIAIAIPIAITVLIIASPCAFMMISPLSITMSSTVAKRESIIFNSSNIFEVIKNIDIISFDKTGTLTEGKFNVISNTFDEKILSLLVSAEKNSNHPLAISIVKNFKNITLQKVDTEEIIGKGLILNYGDKKIRIGSLMFVNETHAEYIEPLDLITRRKNGSAFVYGFDENKIYGYFELKDTIKDTAIETLNLIREMNIDIVMITGDQKDTAIHIGEKLGIKSKNIYYEVSPEDKSIIIKKLQESGKTVSFVGDGINDAIALTQADLGIAMGEGSDAAIEVADIVLNKPDLTLVPYAISLSRKTLFNINRGFVIGVIYNIVAIPIAMTGIITPALGAAFMVINDSVAMINSATLTRSSKKRLLKIKKK